MEVRYLLDENISSEWRNQLLHHQPNLMVWMIGDPLVPAQCTLDPEILVWCEEHRFLLVKIGLPIYLESDLIASLQNITDAKNTDI